MRFPLSLPTIQWNTANLTVFARKNPIDLNSERGEIKFLDKVLTMVVKTKKIPISILTAHTHKISNYCQIYKRMSFCIKYFLCMCVCVCINYVLWLYDWFAIFFFFFWLEGMCPHQRQGKGEKKEADLMGNGHNRSPPNSISPSFCGFGHTCLCTHNVS